MTRPTGIEDRLRRAWSDAPGCPPPAAYLDEEQARLAAAERERLARHADECPACAAERDLARAFDAAPAGRAAEVEDIVRRLAEAGRFLATGAPVGGREAETVVPAEERSARGRRGAGRRPSWRRPAAVLPLAAGLALAVASAVLWNRSGPPPLPEAPRAGVVRGAAIEGLAPAGELEARPDAFRWATLEDAASYRLILRAPDGADLWSGEAATSPWTLPAEVRALLAPTVLYSWQVEALDGAGRTIAASPPVRFRLATDAIETPAPPDSP